MKLHFNSNRFQIPESEKEIFEQLLFSWPILFFNIFIWSFLVGIISFHFHQSIIISTILFSVCFTVGVYVFKIFVHWLEK